MLSQIFTSAAAIALISLAKVNAEEVHLYTKSDNDEVDGFSLGWIHEGAAVEYVFLGSKGGDTEALNFEDNALEYDWLPGYPQYVSFGGNYVQVASFGPANVFTFDDDNLLQVNGTSKNFYACKNTNDPYSYSASSYELMYYESDAPSDCISVEVEKSSGADASSTTLVSSTTAAPSSQTAATSSTPVEFEGAAAGLQYAPAAGLAAVGAFAAALL
ncbi:hypothetical protein DAMA08_053090 [Martiniozyma asiatica (nom. inval.)]|nr:hypothetical protein DAMA08_053090 [Martiniozyma asiatica]